MSTYNENLVNLKIDLSIVIVSYNTRELLLACLQSLYEMPQPYTFEVIVSDNASSDGSEATIRNDFPQVMVIQNGENLGFGTAMNIGVKSAVGKYLLVLNPDTLVPPETLVRLLKYLVRQTEPRVVSCRLISPEGIRQLSCARFPTPLRLIFLFTRLSQVIPFKSMQAYYDRFNWGDLSTEGYQDSSPRKVDTVLGAFFMLPTEAFRQVGGFDENFFMHYEEIDLFKRLDNVGCEVFFLPDISVTHYGGASTKQEYAKMRLEQQISLLYYLRKWHGLFAMETIRLFLIVFAIFRLLFTYVPTMKDKIQNRKTAISILSGLLRIDFKKPAS